MATAARSIIAARNAELRAEGCILECVYRWSDGFQQTAFFKADQVREFASFVAMPLFARPRWWRDLSTGRFARVRFNPRTKKGW